MVGVVIGRFMPPHRGHQYLIDFARGMVDRLYVLVCTLSWEPIPGDLRFQWVQELFPSCTVVHITEEIPEARRDNPRAPGIWADTIRRYVPDAVTHVFASEDYGWKVAAEMDATFVPVDPARHSIPVSASAIRANPMSNWQFIPPPVRDFFVRHVAILDAADLARTVARALETVVIESYRHFVDASVARGRLSVGTIEQAERSAVHALSRHANRVVIHSIPSVEWETYRDLIGVGFDSVLRISDHPLPGPDQVVASVEAVLEQVGTAGASLTPDHRNHRVLT